MNYDELDTVVQDLGFGDFSRFRSLTTVQRLYVIIASNRVDLLEAEFTTLPKALQLIDEVAISEICKRYA